MEEEKPINEDLPSPSQQPKPEHEIKSDSEIDVYVKNYKEQIKKYIKIIGEKLGKKEKEISDEIETIEKNNFVGAYACLKKYYHALIKLGYKIDTKELSWEKLSQLFYYGIFDRLGWSSTVIKEPVENSFSYTLTLVNQNAIRIRKNLCEIISCLNLSDNFYSNGLGGDISSHFDLVQKYIIALMKYRDRSKDLKTKNAYDNEIQNQKQALTELVALIAYCNNEKNVNSQKKDNSHKEKNQEKQQLSDMPFKYNSNNKKHSPEDIEKIICEGSDVSFNLYIESLCEKCLVTIEQSGIEDIASRFSKGAFNQFMYDIDTRNILLSSVNHKQLRDSPNKFALDKLNLFDEIMRKLNDLIESGEYLTPPSSNLDEDSRVKKKIPFSVRNDLINLRNYFARTRNKIETEYAVYHTPGKSHTGEYGVVNPRISFQKHNDTSKSESLGQTTLSISPAQKENENGIIEKVAPNENNSSSSITSMEKRYKEKLNNILQMLQEKIKKMKEKTMYLGENDLTDNIASMFGMGDTQVDKNKKAIAKLFEKLESINIDTTKTSLNKIFDSIERLNKFLYKKRTKDTPPELFIDAGYLLVKFKSILYGHKKIVNFLSASDPEKCNRMYEIVHYSANYDIKQSAERALQVNLVYTTIPENDLNSINQLLDQLLTCKTAEEYDNLLTEFCGLIYNFHQKNTFWSGHCRDVLAKIILKIVQTHYVKKKNAIQLDFSEAQLENAKNLLESISPSQNIFKSIFLKHNYGYKEENLAAVQQLEAIIAYKKSDIHHAKHLMINPEAQDLSQKSSYSLTPAGGNNNYNIFQHKLGSSIIAGTMAELVISTGRVVTTASAPMSMLTTITNILTKVVPIAAPVATVVNTVGGKIDNSGQKKEADNAADFVGGDIIEWFNFVSAELVPTIAKFFKANIKAMKETKGVVNFAQFIQKRMFNALRSKNLDTTAGRESVINFLVGAIYDNEYDNFLDKGNPFYGRYRQEGDESFFGESTFREMLKNAPVILIDYVKDEKQGEKKDEKHNEKKDEKEVSVYFNLTVIEEHKIKNSPQENGNAHEIKNRIYPSNKIKIKATIDNTNTAASSKTPVEKLASNPVQEEVKDTPEEARAKALQERRKKALGLVKSIQTSGAKTQFNRVNKYSFFQAGLDQSNPLNDIGNRTLSLNGKGNETLGENIHNSINKNPGNKSVANK